MAKKHSARNLLALSMMAAGGYLLGKKTSFKPEHKADANDSRSVDLADAERELKQLHSEIEELLEAAKRAGQPLSSYSLKKLDEVLKAGRTAKDRLSQVIEAVRTGEAEDKDLAFAVKEAEQALKHAKKFLLKN